jgi:predicted kinase
MRLFIITGPPASGKSTVSNKMSEMFDKSALLEGDLVYDMVKKGIEVPWNSEKHVNLAYQNLADLSGNFLSSGFDVVLDWIVMPDQIGKLIEKIGIRGLRVYFIVLMVDLEILKKGTG